MLFVTSSLEKKFSQRFPLCADFIKSKHLELLFKEFTEFIKEESLSPFERWWPLFLKENQNNVWANNKDVDLLCEVAQYEFYQIWAGEIDLGANSSRDLIQINSTFQYVFIDKASELLSLSQGLYGIFKKPNQDMHPVQVLKLNEAQALMLDTLGEDRTFTEEQLAQWMDSNYGAFQFQDKNKTWRAVLTDLISKGILIQSIHSAF